MKVLMIEPGKIPYETDIRESLVAMEIAVGGSVQAVYPYEDFVALVCNEEGKLIGLPLNRALRDEQGEVYDIISGTFFICGLNGVSFTDLSADLMDKYREQFKHPEKFVHIAGKYLAVKQPIPEEQTVASRGDNDRQLDDSTELAFDLDMFFRQNSPDYFVMYPDSHAEKERLADELLSGQTSKIRMRMATVLQEEHLEQEMGSLFGRISAYEKEYGISAYSVYQLTLSDSTDQYRFRSYDWLEHKGLPVEFGNYQMVYSAELPPGDTLNTIYEKLNLYRPADFKGHSLSVSDIVVLHEKGSDTAYYVDSVGFREVPDFLKPVREAETRQVTSLYGQLDSARKQAAKTGLKPPDKKREPERS